MADEQTLENSQEQQDEKVFHTGIHFGGKTALEEDDTAFLKSLSEGANEDETADTSHSSEDEGADAETDSETPDETEDVTEEETDEEQEGSDEEQEGSTETSEEESTEGGEEELPKQTLLELKVNGETFKFDLENDEDRDAVIQFAQKGKNYENKVHELNQDKTEVGNQKVLLDNTVHSLAFYTLFNRSQGSEAPRQSDYIAEGGKYYDKFDNDEDALKAYEADKKSYLDMLPKVEEFQKSFNVTKQKYGEMMNRFKEAHPNVTDMAKWLEENVNPYHAPIHTFGATPYPEDTLEMIYFWRNKDEFEKNIREDERRKLATKTPSKPKGPTSKKTQPTKKDELGETVNKNIASMFGGDQTRKIVH